MAKNFPKTLYVFEEEDRDATYLVTERSLDDAAPAAGDERMVAIYERKAVVKVTTETKAVPVKE